MSPLGAANSMIIQTRRTARARVGASEKGILINSLKTGLDRGDRRSTGFETTANPRNLFQSGAGPGVSFRHGTDAPRLDAAFVAQLLGQVLPDTSRSRSDALAAYAPVSRMANVCDRML